MWSMLHIFETEWKDSLFPVAYFTNERDSNRSIFKNKIKFAIVVVTRIRKKKKRNSYYSSNPINVSKLRRNTLDTECVNRYPIYVPRHSDSMQLSKSSVPRDPSFHRSLLSLSLSRSRSGQATLTKKLISARALRAGRRRNAAYREANLSTKTWLYD